MADDTSSSTPSNDLAALLERRLKRERAAREQAEAEQHQQQRDPVCMEAREGEQISIPEPAPVKISTVSVQKSNSLQGPAKTNKSTEAGTVKRVYCMLCGMGWYFLRKLDTFFLKIERATSIMQKIIAANLRTNKQHTTLASEEVCE